MFTVYGLCEPFRPEYRHPNNPDPSYNGWWWRYSLYQRIRYVGVTNDIYRRFEQHLTCKDKHNPEKNAWITAHKEQQTMITLEPLQRVETWEIAQIRETYWMGWYHYLGADLLNQTKYNWFPRREYIDATIKRYVNCSPDTKRSRTWYIWSEVYGDEYSYVLRKFKPKEYPNIEFPRDPEAEALARRESTQSWEEFIEKQVLRNMPTGHKIA